MAQSNRKGRNRKRKKEKKIKKNSCSFEISSVMQQINHNHKLKDRLMKIKFHKYKSAAEIEGKPKISPAALITTKSKQVRTRSPETQGKLKTKTLNWGRNRRVYPNRQRTVGKLKKWKKRSQKEREIRERRKIGARIERKKRKKRKNLNKKA